MVLFWLSNANTTIVVSQRFRIKKCVIRCIITSLLARRPSDRTRPRLRVSSGMDAYSLSCICFSPPVQVVAMQPHLASTVGRSRAPRVAMTRSQHPHRAWWLRYHMKLHDQSRLGHRVSDHLKLNQRQRFALHWRCVSCGTPLFMRRGRGCHLGYAFARLKL